MKALFLSIIALFLFTDAYAQQDTKTDSIVADFKTFLSMRVLPIADAVINNDQGTVVVSFKIDDNKNITDAQVVKSLVPKFDAEVLREFKLYRKPVSLPPGEYTVGVRLFIINKKPKNELAPVDTSAYKNYLFYATVKVQTSY